MQLSAGTPICNTKGGKRWLKRGRNACVRTLGLVVGLAAPIFVWAKTMWSRRLTTTRMTTKPVWRHSSLVVWLMVHADVVEAPAAKPRKRGRKKVDAVSASKGNPKQLFVMDPVLPAKRMACLICKAKHPDEPDKYGVAMGNGTTNAANHLWSAHQIRVGLDNGSVVKRQATLTTGLVLTRATIWKQFYMEMIMDLAPFSFLEKPGRSVTQAKLFPDMELPSDDWLRAELDCEYAAQRERLRTQFQHTDFVLFYVLSLDGWTLKSKGRLMYAARLQFLTSDMDFVCIPLEISPIASKSAESVSRWLQRALQVHLCLLSECSNRAPQAMGLPLDRLLVITADGAEKAVADALTDLLREAKFNLIPAADDVNWQDVAALLKVEYWWCGDHRLALVVRHGLEDPKEGSTFVEHTRKFVLKGVFGHSMCLYHFILTLFSLL